MKQINTALAMVAVLYGLSILAAITVQLIGA